MKRKEIILGVLGIIVLVVLAYFVANVIYNNNNKIKNNSDDNKKEDEFVIDGEKINFKTYRVDQVFFINIPSSFNMLSEDELNSKYNYNTRPELVFSSSDDTMHVFVTTTLDDMTDDLLEQYLNNKITELGNMTIIDSKMYTSHDKKFAKLVSTDNTTCYDIRYFTIDNKLVIVEFNLPYANYSKWKNIVEEVMDSICFNEDDIKKYSSD